MRCARPFLDENCWGWGREGGRKLRCAGPSLGENCWGGGERRAYETMRCSVGENWGVGEEVVRKLRAVCGCTVGFSF